MSELIESISFGVLPYSCDRARLERCVASIVKQGVPQQEIFTCDFLGDLPNCRSLPSENWAQTGEFNRLRNRICAQAAGEFVVLIADVMELADSWYDAIKHGNFFDVAASRIRTQDNRRAIDWGYEVKLGSRSFAYPLDYDEWTTKAHVSGSLLLLRKEVWEHIKFPEQLRRDQGDVVEFSLRATGAGYKIGVIPSAEATCRIGDAQELELIFEPSQRVAAAFRGALADGREAFKRRDYAQTIALIAPAIEMVSDEPRALALTGWSHYFTGQYDQAAAFLDRALAANPVDHFALRGRGWTALQSGQHQQAVEFLEHARGLVTPEKRDDWIETLRGLAWSNYHTGRYDAAIEVFSALREKSAANETGLLQDVYRGLGWSCYRKEVMNEAADHFKNALRVLTGANPDMIQDARHGLELSGFNPSLTNQMAEEAQARPPIAARNARSLPAPLAKLRRRLSAVIAPIRQRLKERRPE